MYFEKIKHIALINNWENPELFGNSETLILGSFNPYNTFSEEKNSDYYYGRQTNHLWKIIASLILEMMSIQMGVELSDEIIQKINLIRNNSF